MNQKELKFLELLKQGLTMSKARKMVNLSHKKAVSISIENGFVIKNHTFNKVCLSCSKDFKSRKNEKELCRQCYKNKWSKINGKDLEIKDYHIDLVNKIQDLSDKGYNISEICRELATYDKVVKLLSKRFNIKLNLRNRSATKPKELKFIENVKNKIPFTEAIKDAGINHKRACNLVEINGLEPIKAIQSDSGPQMFIYEWAKSHYPNTVNNFKLKNKKHIDVYIPELGIGIEYCGLYWHTEDSPEPRDEGYHINKQKAAHSQGIRLIFIFEDEWLLRKPMVMNFLKSTLNIYETRVYARKCEVKVVPKNDALFFIGENHIQGPKKGSKIFFGLYYKDSLVGVMSGGEHHRSGNGKSLILDRLCFKSGYSIPGGSSRLLKYLIEYGKQNNYEKIVSWSDNRWSIGTVYERIGFTLEENIRQDHSYVKNRKRYGKQSLKKTKEEQEGALTEFELRKAQGYSRIWDCGKKRWVFNLN